MQMQAYPNQPTQNASQMQVVTQQPTQVFQPGFQPQQMKVLIGIPVYQPIPGVPPGLEPLFGIDSIIVQQQIELIEVITDIETNNRYAIMNPLGQRMYFAAEQTDCCSRMCLGNSRPFLIRIFDALGREAFQATRECNCALCWWGGEAAGSDITVRSTTTGQYLGGVKQVCSGCTPQYEVFDAANNLTMKIRGPCCSTCCPMLMCCDAKFDILSVMGGKEQSIGFIMKSFALQEMISDATNFGMRIPPGLDPAMKAVLVGAVFCIDFSFFERSNSTPPSGCVSFTAIMTAIIMICLVLAFGKG